MESKDRDILHFLKGEIEFLQRERDIAIKKQMQLKNASTLQNTLFDDKIRNLSNRIDEVKKIQKEIENILSCWGWEKENKIKDVNLYEIQRFCTWYNILSLSEIWNASKNVLIEHIQNADLDFWALECERDREIFEQVGGKNNENKSAHYQFCIKHNLYNKVRARAREKDCSINFVFKDVLREVGWDQYDTDEHDRRYLRFYRIADSKTNFSDGYYY